MGGDQYPGVAGELADGAGSSCDEKNQCAGEVECVNEWIMGGG